MAKHQGYEIEVFQRSITFYANEIWVSVIPGVTEGVGFPQDVKSDHVKLKTPEDASVSFFADQILISLRSDWNRNNYDNNNSITYKAGSLIVASLLDFISTTNTVSFQILFEPTARSSLDTFITTQNYLILSILNNVKSQLFFWKFNSTGTTAKTSGGSNNKWVFEGSESSGVVRGTFLTAVDDEENDDYWLTMNSFIQPSTLYIANASEGIKGITSAEKLKQLPSQFDSTDLIETQGEATSADGTKIPYFIVSKSNMKLDGSTPTLLYGYGGFEISMTPSYAAIVGSCWLEQGGCYVVANIRGGGEFGPSWHQAALKKQRVRAYDDFIAVAEELIAKKITSVQHLGIRGGSNGGLLMGNMITKRPDLFGAVCCAVP